MSTSKKPVGMISRARDAATGTVAALGVSAVMTFAAPVAAAQDGVIRYNYIEGGYQRLDVDGFSGKGDGGFLGGSVQVHDAAFLSAQIDYADLGRGADVRTLELAGGVRYALTRDFDAVLQLGYIDARIDTRFGDFNDNGLFVSGGGRWMIAERVELNGAVKYVDLDESGDDWIFTIGGVFDVGGNFALLAGFDFTNDADILSLGLRYYF
jgi:hypothetical protein